MSRSGLFRAAALLAVSASPLLVGSANAAETPELQGLAPEVGADKVVPVVEGATQATNPMDATNAVKLPAVQAPAVPAAPALPATAERAEAPLPIGTLPQLPDTKTFPNAKIADAKAPAVADLPVVENVQGTLPALG